MENTSRIFVAGSRTAVGAAIVEALKLSGFANLIGIGNHEPDLTNQLAVRNFFKNEAPEYVFLAAGKSGGTNANGKYPASLIYDNLIVECNVIHTSYKYNVQKLLFLASSLSYPLECPQPMKEEYLMTGKPDPAFESYAAAKLAGIAMCSAYRQQHGVDFIAAIPADSFGPGQDFSPEDSNIIASLIVKMHTAKAIGAKSVKIPEQAAQHLEFIFTGDLADACVTVMQDYTEPGPINLGAGADISIEQLAEMIRDITGFKGEFRFITNNTNIEPARLLNSSKIQSLSSRTHTPLADALQKTYEYYLSSIIGREKT